RFRDEYASRRHDPVERLERGSVLTSMTAAEDPPVRGISAAAETRAGIVQYWPDQPFVGASIHRYGEYLQQQNELLLQVVPPGARIVEAAAGVGIDAIQLAAAIG